MNDVVTQPDEVVIREGGANLFRGIEAVGGRLTLTTKRLLFRGHLVNLQRFPEAIYLKDMAEVKLTRVLLIRTAVLIRLSTGMSYKFVVFKPKQWVEAIKQARTA